MLQVSLNFNLVILIIKLYVHLRKTNNRKLFLNGISFDHGRKTFSLIFKWILDISKVQ